MEFDYKGTKYCFIAMIVGVIAAFGWMFYMIYSNDAAADARHAKYREDCLRLNPQYGKAYKTKEGFYENEILIAVGADEESVRVVIQTDPSKDTLRFRCDDLKLVEEEI